MHHVAAGDADDVGLRAVPRQRIVVLEVVSRDVHGPRRDRVQVARGDGLVYEGYGEEEEGNAEGVAHCELVSSTVLIPLLIRLRCPGWQFNLL